MANISLQTIGEQIAAHKHNSRFSVTATLVLADMPREITFRVTPHMNCMAVATIGLSAIGKDADEAFNYLQKYALQAAKTKLAREMAEFAKKPMWLQAQFGGALEARMRRIEMQLA